MVVAGHYLATEAGLKILEAGGNAVDAGVAAGIALGVLHSDQVQFSGVAPMLIYIKKLDKLLLILISIMGDIICNFIITTDMLPS